jgi:hypothetical protein
MRTWGPCLDFSFTVGGSSDDGEVRKPCADLLKAIHIDAPNVRDVEELRGQGTDLLRTILIEMAIKANGGVTRLSIHRFPDEEFDIADQQILRGWLINVALYRLRLVFLVSFPALRNAIHPGLEAALF